MNIRTSFHSSDLGEVRALRDAHLDALGYAQDALLEVFAQQSEVFRIDARGEAIGYFLLHQRRIVEFYVALAFEQYAHLIFPDVLQAFAPTSALIKSFDAQFLACALDHHTQVHVRGVLVRDIIDRPLPNIARIHYQARAARREDFESVMSIEREVFTDGERMMTVIEQGNVIVFEQAKRLVGFGMIRPIIEGRPDAEIGIVVAPSFRNRGYAVYILRDLVAACRGRGFIPVAGSARGNSPSLRAGRRIGMLARHRILELTF